MISILLWLLIISIPLGVGIPTQTTDPATVQLDVPWHNWSATNCADPNYWPSIWRAIPGATVPLACADGPLLIGNECERAGQCNTAPDQVAELLHELSGSYPDARLYCCGGHDFTGVLHTRLVLTVYTATYQEPPPLTGLHFHIYEDGLAFDRPLWRMWQAIADEYALPVAISEYACFEVVGEVSVAECMVPLTRELLAYFEPEALFWFSWSYGPEQPFYAQTDVWNGSGYTEVGEKWLSMLTPDILWLPMVMS